MKAKIKDSKRDKRKEYQRSNNAIQIELRVAIFSVHIV